MLQGNQPRMEVKCHVSNCQYYKNDHCHANKIEVNPKGGTAHTSDDALCSTFIPSGK